MLKMLVFGLLIYVIPFYFCDLIEATKSHEEEAYGVKYANDCEGL